GYGVDGEQRAETRERVGQHPVVHPRPASLAVDQSGLAQHPQVMADRRLRDVERAGQVAHAGLAAGERGDQREQPQPHRIRQRLEHPGQRLRVIFGQRFAHHRRAARGRLDYRQLLLRHESMLTVIESAGKLGGIDNHLCKEGCPPCPASNSPCASPTSKALSPSTASSSAPNRPSAALATPTSPSPSPRSSSSCSKARTRSPPAWTTSASRSKTPPRSPTPSPAFPARAWPPTSRRTPPAVTPSKTRSGSPAPAPNAGRSTPSWPTRAPTSK